MIKSVFSFVLLLSVFSLNAQLFSFLTGGDKPEVPRDLLLDRAIQIETTAAINNMYNFNFQAAEREFKWLLVKYPDHPIGYFMLGLCDWWKIVPDTKVRQYDSRMEKYMDETIDKAEEIYDNDKSNKEAAFFMSAAYAFKGRLHAEREQWTKAAWDGKQAMKYLDKSRGDEHMNPELLIGDGLYNFYSKWIHENYKSLRPLLTFFKKGDKKLGVVQLENVSNNAFYTRMEARYFLVQIYSMDNQLVKALTMSRMMHNMYPDNPFFHRYAARSAFALGRLEEASKYAMELLDNISANKYGYGNNDGRYGAYILAYYNQNYKRNFETAKFYYVKCIEFAKNNDSEDSGYYLGSELALGKMAEEEKDYLTAAQKYKLVLENAEKKSSVYKEAKDRILVLKQTLKDIKKKK